MVEDQRDDWDGIGESKTGNRVSVFDVDVVGDTRAMVHKNVRHVLHKAISTALPTLSR